MKSICITLLDEPMMCTQIKWLKRKKQSDTAFLVRSSFGECVPCKSITVSVASFEHVQNFERTPPDKGRYSCVGMRSICITLLDEPMMCTQIKWLKRKKQNDIAFLVRSSFGECVPCKSITVSVASFEHVQNFERTPPDKGRYSCVGMRFVRFSHVRHPVGILYPIVLNCDRSATEHATVETECSGR